MFWQWQFVSSEMQTVPTVVYYLNYLACAGLMWGMMSTVNVALPAVNAPFWIVVPVNYCYAGGGKFFLVSKLNSVSQLNSLFFWSCNHTTHLAGIHKALSLMQIIKHIKRQCKFWQETESLGGRSRIVHSRCEPHLYSKREMGMVHILTISQHCWEIDLRQILDQTYHQTPGHPWYSIASLILDSIVSR